jgi:hypothetical protein
MTREEKQKAIDALKKSAPVMAVTQEEFKDYIQTLNKIMDWLEQEPTPKNDLAVDCISRKAALDITWQDPSYSDPLNVLTEVRDKIRELPSVTPQDLFINKPCVSSGVCEHDKNKVLDKLRAEIDGLPCYFAIHIDKEKVLAIIDKYRAEIEPQESEE